MWKRKTRGKNSIDEQKQKQRSGERITIMALTSFTTRNRGQVRRGAALVLDGPTEAGAIRRRIRLVLLRPGLVLGLRCPVGRVPLLLWKDARVLVTTMTTTMIGLIRLCRLRRLRGGRL